MKLYIAGFMLMLILSGCAGTQTFPNRVLAGETVTLGAGWKHSFSRNEVTIRFIPATGTEVVYAAGDPAIRAILNLYPDPLSGIVISQQTGLDVNPGSYTLGNQINTTYTGEDNDWWQTTVMVDVPASLPVGVTQVVLSNQAGDIASSSIDIIGTGGVPDALLADGIGSISQSSINTLERLDHYVITINNAIVPAMVQFELAGTDFTGYVTQGRSEPVSLNWAYNAGIYKIIMTPASVNAAQKLQNFKVYIAVTAGQAATASLTQVGVVKAFDSTGNPVDGVTLSIQYEKGIFGLSGI